jgi:hypothetical protein
MSSSARIRALFVFDNPQIPSNGLQQSFVYQSQVLQVFIIHPIEPAHGLYADNAGSGVNVHFPQESRGSLGFFIRKLQYLFSHACVVGMPCICR